MPTRGWKQLVTPASKHKRRAAPIIAYSEFMPPPRPAIKPYSQTVDPVVLSEDDPWGWHVTEYEEAFELAPGLRQIAAELLHSLWHLGHGQPCHGLAKAKLQNNPYWPPELCRAGAPSQERYVIIAPLALSRTQDDKGRVRWTLFGGSEQGPAKPFWRSFFSAPGVERPESEALDFFRRLLAGAYGVLPSRLADLRQAGLRILPQGEDLEFAHWDEGPLPSWAGQFVLKPREPLDAVRYLLTFRPFARLPAAVRRAYLQGKLCLLPFPGSLAFWGAPGYIKLAGELPLAMQIPLLHAIERHAAPRGLRVPQSGWMHEPHPRAPKPAEHLGPFRNCYKRTHRWARIHRYEDELTVKDGEDHVAHVLFSTSPADLGLYDKPMARNAQLWTPDHRLLLDGPHAARPQLLSAAEKVAEGGMFGYRFLFPAMQAGGHEVYWHRPLVAWLPPDGKPEPELLTDAPLGYLTAYRAGKVKPEKPVVELWPRLLARPAHQTAITVFDRQHDQRYHRTTNNVRKLLDTHSILGGRPLERSFARQLLTLPKGLSLDKWLAELPDKAAHAPAGRELAAELTATLEPERTRARKPTSLTFRRTALRSFEKEYWNIIAELSTGKYRNKDNADCVLDPVTQARLDHHQRDLDALGDFLLEYYRRTFKRLGGSRSVWIGELPFHWQTDFDYGWSGGWLGNRRKQLRERDLVVMIPGRDRSRAIVMADHYDTAYMEDEFGYSHGGGGPRLAAAGADDNHSATATLMLGAPVFWELSQAGRLECDVWLVHLTGEEFPADCLGARQLCQQLLAGGLDLQSVTGRQRRLRDVRVDGVYVLDMVAHNNDRDRDVFQICPGTSRQSMWLAWQAHMAGDTWNALAPTWNQKPGRRGKSRGRRSADARTLPDTALHPQLSGEVRPAYDPRSTLFNTDGQIFSDAGVPVVLFMENYDINRHGYHDTQDTLANIDLDYGSAVAAIAIEAVARAAGSRK
ncbi:MAG TPA: M28 family peptidase [Pirellulales bacterium]|jgi:hypothetical protein|nr:M28 family peptidase [Pirellulales bacterium]